MATDTEVLDRAYTVRDYLEKWDDLDIEAHDVDHAQNVIVQKYKQVIRDEIQKEKAAVMKTLHHLLYIVP